MYEYLEINSDTYKIKKDAKLFKANISPSRQSLPFIDQTRKMFISGSQKRGDSGHSIEVFDKQKKEVATVGRGNRKDIRNAVEAANKKVNLYGLARLKIRLIKTRSFFLSSTNVKILLQCYNLIINT